MSNWFASKWFASKYHDDWFGRVSVVSAPIIIRRERVKVGARFIRCGPAGAAPYCPSPLSETYAAFKSVIRAGKGVKPLDPKITEKRTKERRDNVKTQEIRALKVKVHDLQKKVKDTLRTLERERATNVAKFEPVTNRFAPKWTPMPYSARRLFSPIHSIQNEEAPVPQETTYSKALPLIATPVRAPVPWTSAVLAALPWSAASAIALLGTIWLVPDDKRIFKFVGYAGTVILFTKGIESGLHKYIENESTK